MTKIKHCFLCFVSFNLFFFLLWLWNLISTNFAVSFFSELFCCNRFAVEADEVNAERLLLPVLYIHASPVSRKNEIYADFDVFLVRSAPPRARWLYEREKHGNKNTNQAVSRVKKARKIRRVFLFRMDRLFFIVCWLCNRHMCPVSIVQTQNIRNRNAVMLNGQMLLLFLQNSPSSYIVFVLKGNVRILFSVIYL